MKKLILTAVIIVLGMNVGCRLGCTPYDNCGPVFANPFNCAPNYRSGSAFNGAVANQGELTPEAPASAPTPAATPATTPTTDTITPPATPTPSASPAPIQPMSYNTPIYRTNQQSFQTAYRSQYRQR